ncbi:hypothetical protein COCNU_scaffold027154G000010 [Cocos nucifera]|nr:hypothetical protein [Cocos nucifera]
MKKKKREEEQRKREEEKKVDVEKKKKTDVGDKPKTLTYSLERRIKKEHRMHKTTHLIENPNYETCLPIKKTKIVHKSIEGFIKHSREYQGKSLLFEEEDASIEIFLTERITSEVVFNNAEGGSITRSNIYDLLFARMIIDDIKIMTS